MNFQARFELYDGSDLTLGLINQCLVICRFGQICNTPCDDSPDTFRSKSWDEVMILGFLWVSTMNMQLFIAVFYRRYPQMQLNAVAAIAQQPSPLWQDIPSLRDATPIFQPRTGQRNVENRGRPILSAHANQEPAAQSRNTKATGDNPCKCQRLIRPARSGLLGWKQNAL